MTTKPNGDGKDNSETSRLIETAEPMHPVLARMSFRYPLRKYQEEIIQLVNSKLDRGERQLHIVAPPGAGKTIMGLQIISQFKVPSLVLCPNTTIQSQWGQKVDLFIPPEMDGIGIDDLLGTHEDKPLKPITMLTYQVLSTPGREQEYLDKLAHKSFVEELTRSQSLTVGDAELRILELMQNNRAAYKREMSRHASRLRRRLTDVLDLNDVLHANALSLIQSLRRQKFKLVIFDECHHLTDYWAAIMTHLVARLDDPVIVGLTGTPPEGKSASQENRYMTLVGAIDYQVPTPALVKEGGLAPFQDLVYFTEPTDKERQFLEGQHEEFHHLILELTAAPGEDTPAPLTAWVVKRVNQFVKEGWVTFAAKYPDLLTAICRYVWKERLPLPDQMELSESLRQSPFIDDWMALLEDYALNGLKVSPSPADHAIYDRIRAAVRKLGYGLTEGGIRKQASPVDRVLAYSKSKPQAVARILESEYGVLSDRLRAVIVTDFEQMSATSVKSLKGVLDTESGGAIAALRELLSSSISYYLNPCLVTGSLLLVDKRVGPQFLEAARSFIADEGHTFDLTIKDDPDQPFLEISAGSSSWETRLYVGMATAIFERGITKCLVGTRGIFGEGWDSQALNTLLDLTTTTSPVSVKQLRGRSIRLQTNDPLGGRKCANNWDVVCTAPELEKGLNDYFRFVRKHDGYYGISDDGQIECGVGHVHAAFSELTPAEVFINQDEFNKEMLARSLCRDQIYDLWKVGEKYENRELGCIEIAKMRKMSLTPPHIRRDMKYKEHAKLMRASLNGLWWEYGALGSGASGVLALALATWGVSLFGALLPLVAALELARRKHNTLYGRMQEEICRAYTQESSLRDIGVAVFTSLQQVKLLPAHINRDYIAVTIRSDGSYRVFLDNVESVHADYFARSFKEVLEPITNQPYLIPKYEYSLPRSMEPEAARKSFFRSYLRGNAEPRIGAYHALPKLLARSEKGREAFQAAWNKYVSPGFVVATETKPELLRKYFGMGPSLAQRLIWE